MKPPLPLKLQPLARKRVEASMEAVEVSMETSKEVLGSFDRFDESCIRLPWKLFAWKLRRK